MRQPHANRWRPNGDLCKYGLANGMSERSGVAPDGSPVALYARLEPMGEPEIIHANVPPASKILELGAGAGRITRALLALGHSVVAVDESPEMLAHIEGAETVVADVLTLDLDRRFPVVVLASNFINEVEAESRRAFLACCARHVRLDGRVLLQGFPRGWTPTTDWWEQGDVRGRLLRYTLERAVVSGEMEYVVEGRRYVHSFRSRLVTDAELEDDLAAVGLRERRRLDPGGAWIEAVPAPAER
jgi:SAM-dependent methyltransferase